MVFGIRMLLLLALFAFTIPGDGFAAPSLKKSAAAQETLDQYMEDLKKSPGDNALREKIIKLALTMKPAPEVPETAERSIARGTAFAQKATDGAGHKKAISEFKSAANAAPWVALIYYNLGVVQEKAGLYAEALQNLKLYLVAAPEAKNSRDVKNKIYALEADVEDLQTGKSAPAPTPAPAPAEPGVGKALAVASKPTLELEPEKQLNILKMPPPEKRARLPNFIGNWYFKDTLRGEELTLHAFELSKNANGDLAVTPPKRAADSYATVQVFEISDKTLKLQMKWMMHSTVGYWKVETYELTLSDDNKTLTGSHNQKSVGGRSVDMDRVLFRQ